MGLERYIYYKRSFFLSFIIKKTSIACIKRFIREDKNKVLPKNSCLRSIQLLRYHKASIFLLSSWELKNKLKSKIFANPISIICILVVFYFCEIMTKTQIRSVSRITLKKIQLLEWLAYSLDLNPIENV